MEITGKAMPASSRKTRRPKVRDPLPQRFKSLEKAADFWDSHDSALYEDEMREVDFDIQIKDRSYLVMLDTDLYRRVKSIAKKKGISAQTLVNKWIREKAS